MARKKKKRLPIHVYRQTSRRFTRCGLDLHFHPDVKERTVKDARKATCGNCRT